MSEVAEKQIIIEGRAAETARSTALTAPDASALMRIIDRAAMDPNFDVAKLQALLAVKKEWEADEARKAFVAALADFKANPPELFKNRHVKFETAKGTTEYHHATLDHVSNEIGKALAKHGLSHRWNVEQLDGGMIKVTCVLTHQLGHSESVSMQSGRDDSGSKNNIQALGSSVTYLQRYTLLAATGMATKGQDDDGRDSGEGSGLDEKIVADHLAAIDDSGDLDELKERFGDAWTAAINAGDKGAQRLFTQHKDARKKALGGKS